VTCNLHSVAVFNFRRYLSSCRSLIQSEPLDLQNEEQAMMNFSSQHRTTELIAVSMAGAHFRSHEMTSATQSNRGDGGGEPKKRLPVNDVLGQIFRSTTAFLGEDYRGHFQELFRGQLVLF
jgi:hypothetical protein